MQITKIVCLFCFVFILPQTGLSQENWPQIEYATVNKEVFLLEKKGMLRYGVENFGTGTYVDLLANHIDTIYGIDNDQSESLIYQAVWDKDTLTYSVRPEILRTYTYDSQKKKKVEVLEVESQIPPFSRFSAVIEGLEESTIDALADSMLRMKSSSPILLNNYQTCIFYALEAIFRSNQVNPEPIITRNTNFKRVEELNAFFDHFLTITNTYKCSYKELKNKTFPEHSVLAFLDDYGQIIHAVFYQNGLFYTKNGISAPLVLSDLKPILESYGRWDTKQSGLSKTGKQMLGNVLAVYTLNKELFQQ